MRLFFLLFLFCISSQTILVAQESEQQLNAAKQALKEGSLIVFLPTQHKAIEHLTKMRDQAAPNSADYERYNKQIEIRMAEVKLQQTFISRAFRAYYTLNEVYFLFDSDWKQLQAGQAQGLFLNDHLEKSDRIIGPKDNFLIVRKYRADQSRYTIKEALVVYDQAGRDLPEPFPAATSLKVPFALAALLSPSEDAEQRKYNKAVHAINNKLKHFLED